MTASPIRLAMRSQQDERADRIGAPPAERRALLRRQRFRKDQEPVEAVEQAQARRDPERQARIVAAGNAADRRPEHEAGAERDAEHAEQRRALVRLGDVGDIGIAGRDAGGANAGDDPPDEQPGQRRRQRHQDVVEAEPEIRQQDHRPPSEAIRQRAVDRREQELHQRPGGAEQAEIVGAADRVAADEIEHELRQHRDDDADRQHVEQHGDEDEGEGGAAKRSGCGSHAGSSRLTAAFSCARHRGWPSRAASAGSAFPAGRRSRAGC